MKRKLIYAVDDEKDILDIIQVNLSYGGYDVLTYQSARAALEALSDNMPDLILLDIMMDEMDGYEFCRRIRSVEKYSSIPIIFLTAKSEEFDKVLGLELGGDDYMTKPFSIKELSSRVKAVLRRSGTSTVKDTSDTACITYKGLRFYPDQYTLIIDDKQVKLTKTEFEMLHLFLKHPGKVYSRDNIIDSTRGNDVYVIDRTIDVHIMNLRKKLGKYKNIVTTISGIGYGFKETDDV